MSGHGRSVTWGDPREVVAAVAARRLSGLEFLRALRDGEISGPPFGALLGFTVDEVDPGRVVFGLQPGVHHDNPNGVMHGGVAAALLDTVTGCAVTSLLPFGVTCATLEIKVNYIRSLSPRSPRVRAIGTVLHLGRRSAVAEGKLLLPNDHLCAHATATLMIFPPEELHGHGRPSVAGGETGGVPPETAQKPGQE